MKAVGLDVSTCGVKVVVLDGSAARPRVTRFVDYQLKGGGSTRSMEPESIGRLLLKLFEKHKLPRENVVAAVPAASCLVRELQVPFVRDDQIAKTIKFQAESAFHSVQIDDMIVNHYKVDETGARSRLIVLAYRKDALERQLDACAFADIDPIAVGVDATALFNAWQKSVGKAVEEPTLLVDLGSGSLKIVVAEKGRIRAIRSLRANAAEVRVEKPEKRPRMRSGSIDDVLSESRADTFFADEDGRLPVVILDEDQADLFDFDSEEGRHSALEKVFFEIDRTLARTFLTQPVQRIVLTGGGSLAKGLRQAFAERFEADCERFRPAGVGASKLGADERAAFECVGATALGLALKGLGHDVVGFDLRAEEFQYAGTFERLKSGLACTLVLLFVLFFLVAFRYQIVETERLYEKQDLLRLFQREVYMTVFAEEPKEGSIYLDLRQRQKKLRQRHGDQLPDDVVSSLDVLRDFARAAEKSGREVRLHKASFRGRRNTVELIVDDRTHVFDIKKELNDGDYMVTIESERIDVDSKTDEIRAQLSLALREEPQRGPGRPR